MPGPDSDELRRSLEKAHTALATASAAHPRAGAPTHGPLVPGTALDGTYTIRDLIGSGGMGEVYEAHDHALNRSVAIKLAWRHVNADDLVAEARALAAFRHPGVVTVHAIGRHEGRPFIVMERVYGRDLLQHLRKLADKCDRFTIGEAIDVLIRIAEIVATVHDAGIAHCDLKPDNILLAANRRVVLLDFGVFQPERRLADRPRLFATPYYAAPEIVVNEVEPGRGYLVDIYAFGVIAYEILTGHPPLRGETSAQTLMKHVSEQPPPVSDERPDTPAWLTRLIQSMLAKEPLERPESVASIIAQLRQARAAQPSSARALPTRSVLIADDDDEFRELVVQCVRSTLPGADIRTAIDGDDALAQFRHRPPTLLITDLQMPGMSGVELCMYLRGTRLAERTRIIAMSAHADDGDHDLLHQLGIHDVLGKRGHGARAFAELLTDAVRGAAPVR